MEFLEFLETNSLAIWLSESTSLFAYPTLLVFHTFGMAFLAGTSTAISLRLLGFASAVPLAPLRKFFPVMWLGLAMSAGSGDACSPAERSSETTKERRGDRCRSS